MKKIYTQKTIFVLSLIILALTFNACRKNQVSIKESDRYTTSDVKSYDDLFEVFWKTMDQNYNYFYEQERRDGMDWDAIYKKYKPKFSVMKTLKQDKEFTQRQISDDSDSAKKYFTDIIDPIMDRHFNVQIILPASKGQLATKVYRGNMKDTIASKIKKLPFESKYAFMKSQVIADKSVIKESNPLAAIFGGSAGINLITGPLKSNPDIQYITFDQFGFIPGGFMIDLADKYLSPDANNKYLLSQASIEKSEELKKITNPAIRKKTVDAVVALLNSYNKVYKSERVKELNAYVTNFKKTEIVTTEFINFARDFGLQIDSLQPYTSLRNLYVYPPEVSKDPTTRPFLVWFVTHMNDYVNLGLEGKFARDAMTEVVSAGEFYQKFLNPLHNGTIKKLIIDLRGNGGGAVVDSRFFADRLITKITNYASQRTKQGNSKFDYTPWVPVATKVNKFGIPKEIPIVILTDRGSASMSELTTMMLKSQGPQVVSMGDYSIGATAGLGPSDLYNGGIIGNVGGYLTFYMPYMATKDAHGKVIEGIGVKPEYMVAPPTDAELEAISNAPASFKDRVIEQAIKVVNGL